MADFSASAATHSAIGVPSAENPAKFAAEALESGCWSDDGETCLRAGPTMSGDNLKGRYAYSLAEE